MELSWDEDKRQKTLRDRGLDFGDCDAVFAGATIDAFDDRKDYGEPRVATYGWLNGRMIAIVWTPRDGGRRIISMRKANDREQIDFAGTMDRP